MARYVAFLRGINLPRRGKVDMPRLRATFEDLGGDAVRTYINSGNVIFDDDREPEVLIPKIDVALATTFGAEIRTLVRTRAGLSSLLAQIPGHWANDASQRTDVLFLFKDVDEPSIMDRIVFDPTIETVVYVPGALVWNIPRENARQANEIKLIRTELYRHLTIRNLTTVTRLVELMDL
jgi:uncharacterized protein (DUF1697 family)